MELCGCHGQDVGRFPWLSVGFGGVITPSLLCVALARCVVALCSVHKEPLQPNVCHQWAPAAVAGGQTGTEQTARAGAAAGERAAAGGTRCFRVRRKCRPFRKET